MRGFVEVEGCLEGGGGGCETSVDDVVSIDKERMGIKGDVIWRRDVCSTADNMMRVCMQQGMESICRQQVSLARLDRSRATPRSDSDHPQLCRRDRPELDFDGFVLFPSKRGSKFIAYCHHNIRHGDRKCSRLCGENGVSLSEGTFQMSRLRCRQISPRMTPGSPWLSIRRR